MQIASAAHVHVPRCGSTDREALISHVPPTGCIRLLAATPNRSFTLQNRTCTRYREFDHVAAGFAQVTIYAVSDLTRGSADEIGQRTAGFIHAAGPARTRDEAAGRGARHR